MEEKKEIKVKLSTVVIIFLILIIIGLIALLYLQSTKINNINNQIANDNVESTSKNNNLTNESENLIENEEIEEDSNLKGEKLIQFDTEFFYLDDIAKVKKEEGEIGTVETYNYDLDGDGTKDQISIEYSNNGCTLRLNENIFYEQGYGSFYIVDLNENDKTLEIIITGYAGSERSEYIIFSKAGDKMESLEAGISGLTGEFMLDRKGKIVSRKFASFVKPSVYDRYYVFENGKIVEHKLNINDIKDVEFVAERDYYYFSKEADNLYKIEDYLDYVDGQGSVLVENDLIQKLSGKFKILELNFKGTHEFINVELTNGDRGYITTGYGIFIY